MTHSLHRRGSVEDLRNDYVLLVTPAIGINHEGKKSALQRVLDIVFDAEPNNIGSMESTGSVFVGTSRQTMKDSLHDRGRVRCVFDSREKMAQVLRRLGEADLGLSITVSGLIDEVVPMAREAGFEPHTINLSLGMHGNSSRLPEERVLEMTSMCGHGLVATNLARAMIKEVRAGHKTLEEAVVKLAQPCFCGILNTERARQILLSAEASESD